MSQYLVCQKKKKKKKKKKEEEELWNTNLQGVHDLPKSDIFP